MVRPSTRLRNIELGLLLVALAVGTGAILLVQLGALGHPDPHVITLAAGLAVLVLAMHVVLRFTARDADPFILPITTALNGLGIAEIYRIDLTPNGVQNHWDDGTRQILWTVLAVGAAIAVLLLVRNHRRLQRYTYIAMLAAIVLLLLPLVPGLKLSNVTADVWIHVGPLNFQPGEIAKIALAMFFAGFLVARRDSLAMVGRKVLGVRLPRGRDLGPILVVWVLALAVIVFEHDLGTGLLLFGMFVAMLYIATGRTSWILLGLLLAAFGAFGAAQVLTYVQGRFTNWLNAFDDKLYNAPLGSYQLVNGIFGLGHGGLFGTGLGQGRPDITPAADSDFIIASLGEEIGLVGLFAIFCLYLLFVSRGFRIGFAGPDDYGKLLAVGLAFVFALQVFVVVGGVTRIIPETGLTTPFLAAGGSSLLANWMIAALLLRISSTIRSTPRTVI
ncbi:FtsW/RodA/SpoVE family cell cycle protein [Amnibacterium sp. CER49]|uniref:FtsW/RodA/SpoVE family cell cycle protein n=1 Tax=Amnibacterium sp. CER49 TaxID=3039161 RepID=UPI002448B552|nr:FtsW/RodA/SpoVE family cell cycle protein [Amnibacterium sp. CER49]MDH2443601.1 FtsW/RodA/SpoVE family cell cycle protein [Amnibacterium sp. CER49]